MFLINFSLKFSIFNTWRGYQEKLVISTPILIIFRFFWNQLENPNSKVFFLTVSIFKLKSLGQTSFLCFSFEKGQFFASLKTFQFLFIM